MASRNSAARNDSAPLEPRSWSQEWIAPDDEPELPGSRRATRGTGDSTTIAPVEATEGAPATASTPETPAPRAPRRKRATTKPIKAIVAEPGPAARPAPAVKAEPVASPRVEMPLIPVAAPEPPVPALAKAPVRATSVQRRGAWLRRVDSRVIGTALALVLLVIAAELLRTPGASADIRELPGQVSGAIQSVVAQPETGYPRIRIPRVGIDLLLVRGDGRTPPVKYEAFTYPRADHVLAEPGTTGNTYVYAHARPGMFGNLHDVNIGDTIEIDYGAGKIGRYRVSEIHKSVSWKDFEWLQPTSDDRVTLQTCDGWRDEDPRYVVVAHRVPDTYTALAR